MKEIPLSRGYVALVDEADYERVSAYKWKAHVVRRKDGSVICVYAQRGVRRPDGTWTAEQLHRFIVGVTDSKIQIDHQNHDGLDNRCSNLRLCNRAENGHNRRLKRNNSSGFKGVHWRRRDKVWQALLKIDGKLLHLGLFLTAEAGARAYDKAALKYFGDYACLNFPGAVTNEL
jgi:hypothetical protein